MRRRFSTLIVAAVGLASLFPGTAANADLRIGVWDSTRSGNFALATSSTLSNLRNAIATSFAGVTFSTTSTLTSGFLSGVDVVLLTSAAAGNTATTPLTAAEQSALSSFVLGGKGALLFADNDTFDPNAPTANNSLISPFGLHVTGTLNSIQNVTPLAPTGNPVTNGPFGLVTSLTTFFPGFFDNLGPNAQNLANLDANGQSGLARIPAGTLGAGSAPVVLFSDSSLLDNSILTANDSVAIRNALTYVNSVGTAAAAPEPGSLTLLVLSGLPLVGVARVIVRRRGVA